MKFKISYKLMVNNEKYERNFSDENSEHNVYKLTGWNELGKTTTLEVVAYAFGVARFDTPTVSENLRDKIKKFDSSNVELSYDISIEAGDTIVELKSDKSDKYYKLNNNYVTSNDINNKFVVFFDVPEELYSKLRNSIKNVENIFNNYADELNRYQSKLYDMYKELNYFEQRDDKRGKLKGELDKIKNDIQTQEELLRIYTSQKDEKFPDYIIYQHNRLINQFDKYNSDIASIEKAIKEYNPNKNKVQSLKSGDVLRGRIYDKKDYFLEYVNSEFTEKLPQFQKLISQLKCLSNPSLLDEEIISSYYTFFDDLRTKLEDDINRYSNQPDIKIKRHELEMIQKLIEIVNEYSDIDIQIPGADVKLLDILNPLYAKEDELKEFLQKNGSIDTKKSLYNDCNNFISLLGSVSTEFKEYTIANENVNPNDDELTVEDLNEMKREKSNLESLRDETARELDKYEDDYDNIPEEKKNISLPQAIIEQEYKTIVDTIDRVNGRLKTLNEEQAIKSELMKEYENIEKPQISMSLDELKDKRKKIDDILQKIGRYTNFIEGFTSSDANSIEIKDSDKAIAENIGRYLASILGYVYHNHKSYNIINIDFDKKEYILEDNTHLSFNFIGRGTSALNSLTAKIEQPVGRKQKIILIDEIGDMDSDNKKKLSEVLKKHSDNKDSILSLLTERNDKNTIEISSL